MSNKRNQGAAALEYVALLHRAVHAMGLFIDERFGSDVSQPEALVLLLLLLHPESTINDVHRAFLHRRSTLTSVVDRLVQKAFVAREIHADDRRSIRLALTKTGTRLGREIADAFERRLETVAFSPRAAAMLTATAEAFQ